jgi:hypothetical protein
MTEHMEATVVTGVADVEKLDISEIRGNSGDRKCLADERRSFVGHPDAISFLRISRMGVFHQPRAISLTAGSMRVMVALCQQSLGTGPQHGGEPSAVLED